MRMRLGDQEASPFASGSRFQLGPRLGKGGMAEVFVALLRGSEGFVRHVAIKRMLPRIAATPALARMFVSEARLAARLTHPNVVQVLDFTRAPDDQLVLIMEYVEGGDLAELLAAGPLPPSLAIFITVEALRALGYAHDLVDPARGEEGVIHRDISPQNVLVSVAGAVKLADFGLAQLRHADDAHSMPVRGKPSYMSPEQMAGDPLDRRTDLYSLGVVLWEMLARRPLFVGSVKEIRTAAMFRDIPRPGRSAAGASSDLEDVVMTLLARDRDARFASAADAIAALLACRDVPLDGRGALARMVAQRVPRRLEAWKPGSIEFDGGDDAELERSNGTAHGR